MRTAGFLVGRGSLTSIRARVDADVVVSLASVADGLPAIALAMPPSVPDSIETHVSRRRLDPQKTIRTLAFKALHFSHAFATRFRRGGERLGGDSATRSECSAMPVKGPGCSYPRGYLFSNGAANGKVIHSYCYTGHGLPSDVELYFESSSKSPM